MLRKSDWDHQKPCIILLVVHKLVQKERATKPETPDSWLGDSWRPTPNPTNKLFQQTLFRPCSWILERCLCQFTQLSALCWVDSCNFDSFLPLSQTLLLMRFKFELVYQDWPSQNFKNRESLQFFLGIVTWVITPDFQLLNLVYLNPRKHLN
jgi:hypothetical protein